MNRIRSLTLVVSLVLGLGVGAAYADDSITKFDKPPVPTKTPPPTYPASLKGVNGMVAVVVIIDESGSVVDATVTKSSDPAFENPSIEAIKRWKFKPAEKDGQAVKAKVTIPVRFNAES
ncbi:MAG: energy transducer TonB [Opitutaceae bacterium]|nr:energy transducer TonB [Opitutaceae bacterium]